MTDDIEQLSLALVGELEANDAAAKLVNPADIPTRFSLLKTMALSPAHYWWAAQQPQDDSISQRLASIWSGPDRTAALRFGTAVHLMLLGRAEDVHVYPERRAGKKWDAFQLSAAECGAKEILNEREHRIATSVAGAIRRHERAMELLFDGTVVEQRINWTFNGKACRSTPDAWCKRWSADLKSAVSAKPDVFTRTGLRLFYHAQGALYRQCLEETQGRAPDETFVIAVEKSPPYPVTVMRFTDEALLVGEKLCRVWSEQLNVCEATNEWPEYAGCDVPFDVPHDEPFSVEFGGRLLEVG